MKPLLAPLIFAAFATITAPIALLLNTFNNRSSRLKKKGTAAEETFLYPFFSKHGCWRPSRRWYWYPVICFSWTYFLTFLLTNSACPAFLWDGRGNFHADVRFINLAHLSIKQLLRRSGT